MSGNEWTKTEERELVDIILDCRIRRCKNPFAIAAKKLGRSVESCRVKWYRLIKSTPSLSEGLCPKCGYHRITPRTKAAREGLCQPCYYKNLKHEANERRSIAEARKNAHAAIEAERTARNGALPMVRRSRVTCPKCGEQFLAGGKND